MSSDDPKARVDVVAATEVERAVATLGELDWLCGFLDDRAAGRLPGPVPEEIWVVLFTSLDAPDSAPALAAAADVARIDDLLRALRTLDHAPDSAAKLVPVARDARDHLDAWLDRHQPAAQARELDDLRRTRAGTFRRLFASRTPRPA